MKVINDFKVILKKYSIFFSIISLLFFVYSCSPSYKIKVSPSTATAISVEKDNSATLMVKSIRFEITADSKIGERYSGAANIKTSDISFKVISEKDIKYYKKMLNEELTKAGYNIVGLELFNEDKNEVKYMLSAKVVDLEYYYYDSAFWQADEFFLEVEWQLFDNSKKEVVFTTRTIGKANDKKSPKEGGPNSRGYAWRIAIRKLLSNKTFVQLLVLK